MTDPTKRFATKDDLLAIAQSAKQKYTNVIESVKLGGTALSVSSKSVNIPVDTSLSATSTNPVQNCIVSRPILSLMGRIGVLPDVAPDEWSTLAASIAAGNGESVIPVGTQIVSPMTDQRAGNTTVYDAAWNVVHHGTAELESGTTKNVAYLQMDRCLPYDTQFSPYQAFLCAVTVIPAGTYNVTFAENWGTHQKAGKTYQFTLTNDLPIGGQLAGFYGCPDQSPSNWRVYAFSSSTAASATETCVVTEGSGGTSLGTLSFAGVSVPASGTPEVTTVGSLRFYGLNSIQRVAYGNNRWLHSPLRQFLNASGANWWVPKTVFDRPPSYVGYDGFLTGIDPDMVSAMLPTKTTTALNNITDGGTAANPLYDVTYDKVFLPSGTEHYLQNIESFDPKAKEGVAWDYWKRVAGTTSPLAWWSYHPEYIQYDLASPTSPRSCWVRAANRGHGNNVAVVHASGYCRYHDAINGHRAAPACALGQS